MRRASALATCRAASASATAATAATAGSRPSRMLGEPREQAGRKAQAAEREKSHVGQARQQKERDRAPGDKPSWQAATAQDPRSERETAGAADGEHRVGGELGQPDLSAGSPAHPPAEDAAEHEHVPRAGPQLKHRREDQPAGLRAAEAIAQRREPGHQHDKRPPRRARSRRGSAASAAAWMARTRPEAPRPQPRARDTPQSRSACRSKIA